MTIPERPINPPEYQRTVEDISDEFEELAHEALEDAEYLLSILDEMRHLDEDRFTSMFWGLGGCMTAKRDTALGWLIYDLKLELGILS